MRYSSRPRTPAIRSPSSSCILPNPFEDLDLPIEARVDDILSRMTLDEKVACLGIIPNVPRLVSGGRARSRACTASRWAGLADGEE